MSDDAGDDGPQSTFLYGLFRAVNRLRDVFAVGDDFFKGFYACKVVSGVAVCIVVQ